MSSQLKTAIVIDDTLIFDGNTIDAVNHKNPLNDAELQLREGQTSVSAADTHVKHLEDAIVGTTSKVKVTKQNPGADESLAIDLDATGIAAGYVPTANGANSWSWAAPGGGGAQPVDVTGTAGENLALRDYVYLDESTGTWFKVDTDVTPVKCGRLRGIVNNAAILSAASGSIRLIGEVSGYAGLTAWSPVYASTTPGGITQTRPSPVSGGVQVAVIEIGMAVSTTNIVVLSPRPTQYMKRNNALADAGTLTVDHHKDEMGHTRRAMTYIGSISVGTVVESYASANQDADVPLRQRTIATYTADETTGGTPSSSSGTALDAFDDDAADHSVLGANPQWLEYDFGVTKTIRRYSITFFNAGLTSYAPKDFELQYYDGAIWQTADSRTNETGWTLAEERIYDVANDYTAQRWRIYITASDGQTSTRIGDIDMYQAATYDDGSDKLSQSFTLSSATDIGGVDLWLKKVGSPVGTATVRIETLSAGDPSGTLADPAATITFAESTPGTGYADQSLIFASSFTLAIGSYAIVLSTDRATSEMNYIQWGADGSTPSYAGGEMKSEASAVWSAESKDAIFTLRAPGTTFVEPASVGRWSGTGNDVAIRYDDGTGTNGETNTTCRNDIGASADVTLVVEIP